MLPVSSVRAPTSVIPLPVTEIDPVNWWDMVLGAAEEEPNILLPEWFNRLELSKLKPSKS